MARKHVTKEFPVFTGLDLQAGASTSAETDCEQSDRILYCLDWTGDSTGNMSLQVSNDKINWKTLPIEPSLDLIAGAGSAFIEAENICWKYSRLSWSVTGGTVGNLNANYKAHSQGA